MSTEHTEKIAAGLADRHYPAVYRQFMGYAERTMTVLHEDGLYRHLRFAGPGTMIGSFDLITVPGRLFIEGDLGGGWSFTREDDMLAWVTDNGRRLPGHINPGYWWEKMPEYLRRAGKGYSEAAFRAQVADLVTAAVEWMGYDKDPKPNGDHVTEVAMAGQYDDAHRRLTAQVEDEVMAYAGSEDMALTALRDFTFQVKGDGDVPLHDGDLADISEACIDYNHHFLLACHAILWGAQRWHEHVKAASR